MKKLKYVLIVFTLLTFFSCSKKQNKYSILDKEICLDAIKFKDSVNKYGYGCMNTKDGRFWDKVYPRIKGIPDTLYNVKIYYNMLDNEQALFQAYKKGDVGENDFMHYYHVWGMDTTLCTSKYVKTFLVIATGYNSKGEKYFTFDTNNDFNLENEKYYSVDSIVKVDKPQKVIYENHINGNIFEDSTWIAFKEINEDMYLKFYEYTETHFDFDSLQFTIKTYPSKGLWNKYSDATFFKVRLDNSEQILRPNQYLKLNDEYYRITTSRDGRKITLKKTPNAKEFGSTQLDMPPLYFKAKSLQNDSIEFPKDFKGKYVLLDFWATSCPPCVQEIQRYYTDIYEKYNDIFEIVGVSIDDNDKKLKKFILENNIKWTIIPDGKFQKISKKYNIYLFPTLYLINPKGNIIASGNDLRYGHFEKYLKR